MPLGHVGISARHSNHFRVSVNTEAKSTVIFHLLYEELLQRKQGMYDHAINLTPRQKLKEFSINVSFVSFPYYYKTLSDLNFPNVLFHLRKVQ